MMPDRGAVAVVAASARNRPSMRFSEVLVQELSRPGAYLGEAVMAAKRAAGSTEPANLYNLLGDPALTLWPAAPAGDRP